MGEEFCKGCEDCTYFKDKEGNFSYFANNKPIQNYNNPFLVNGTLDNSIFNKTDNDASFLTNINNLNNINKNDISSLNSKQINNDFTNNILNNNKYYQRENNISNPGINSDMAKRTHYKFNNIEYK